MTRRGPRRRCWSSRSGSGRTPRRRRHLPGGDRDDPVAGAVRGGRAPTSVTRRRGDFRVARLHVVEPGLARPTGRDRRRARRRGRRRSCSATSSRSRSTSTSSSRCPRDLWMVAEARSVLVVPLRWDPDGFGAIVMIAPRGRRAVRRADDRSRPRHREHRVAGARHRSPALGARALPRARREPRRGVLGGGRRHAWRSRSSAGGSTRCWGRARRRGPRTVATWGDHIADDDRAATAEGLPGDDRDVARIARSSTGSRRLDGSTVWVRDVVHVVRGAQGPRELRGLMVDITERKRAEQALRDERAEVLRGVPS